jgi:phosphate transport system substrate-binding protein
LTVLSALAAAGLLATACGSSSKSSSTTTTGGTGSTGQATTTTAKEAPITATLTASGATFPKPFYDEMVAEYKKVQPGVNQTYAGGGSGKGRQDLADQLVDWAGTDATIPDADKPKFKGGTVLYFPTVAGPITVSYNVSGVDKLQLSPDTIAKIFQRQVTSWDAAEIAADNPGTKLPAKPITVAHRSDGSGTTQNFTQFLVMASPTVWTLKSGSTVTWPADTQAGNGNPGVASIVKSTDGGIGYVDLSDAKASGLKFASIKNKAGKFVEPTVDAASAALAGAQISSDLTYNPLWADGDKSYPITSPTWIIAYQNQPDKAKGAAVKSFLRYVLTDGQKTAKDLDYASLSVNLKSQAVAQLDKFVIPA